MRRNRLLGLVGIMTIAIAGCASESSDPVAESPSPSPVAASPIPSPAAKPSPTAQQPLVAQKPVQTVPGLIPSINSQERSNQVETKIKVDKTKDPFAAVPPALPAPDTATVPRVSQLPGSRPGGGGGTANQPGTTRPGTRPGTAPAATGGGGRGGAGQTAEQTIETPTIPKIQDAPLGYSLPPVRPRSAIAALPPPPSTDTAKAVEVTGVVVVGNDPRAIVVAPGDATSRYVGVGQRISGGKVLVKRIELGDGSEPTVILEENGVEVAKSVGEKPPQPAKPTA